MGKDLSSAGWIDRDGFCSMSFLGKNTPPIDRIAIPTKAAGPLSRTIVKVGQPGFRVGGARVQLKVMARSLQWVEANGAGSSRGALEARPDATSVGLEPHQCPFGFGFVGTGRGVRLAFGALFGRTGSASQGEGRERAPYRASRSPGARGPRDAVHPERLMATKPHGSGTRVANELGVPRPLGSGLEEPEALTGGRDR